MKVAGSVSLVPVLNRHNGWVTTVDLDGEYWIIDVQFQFVSEKALFIRELREDYSDIDRRQRGSHTVSLAFQAGSYHF